MILLSFANTLDSKLHKMTSLSRFTTHPHKNLHASLEVEYQSMQDHNGCLGAFMYMLENSNYTLLWGLSQGSSQVMQSNCQQIVEVLIHVMTEKILGWLQISQTFRNFNVLNLPFPIKNMEIEWYDAENSKFFSKQYQGSY